MEQKLYQCRIIGIAERPYYIPVSMLYPSVVHFHTGAHVTVNLYLYDPRFQQLATFVNHYV